ncbi:MAG: hypothetical protein KJ648_07050 [Candidatus Omnitrophica bacterium]|nr:hypothetical protein [Candidatus Omnitrophota bacterium]MBU1767840.1 hypothetical protein [Candidatus Omnitrophota bacterium]
MMRAGVLALVVVLGGCAAAPTRIATSTAALTAEVTPTVAPPEVWPALAGTPAPVDGLHLTEKRYTELLQAEAKASTCLFPSSNDLKPGGSCPEPTIKASTAFWVGASVGAVVTAAATGVLIYGAIEIVKASK